MLDTALRVTYCETCCDSAPKVRFSATPGQEPEIELALV